MRRMKRILKFLCLHEFGLAWEALPHPDTIFPVFEKCSYCGRVREVSHVDPLSNNI